MACVFFQDDVDQCRQAGMNGFMPKPILLRQVMKTLAEYMPEGTALCWQLATAGGVMRLAFCNLTFPCAVRLFVRWPQVLTPLGCLVAQPRT